MNDLSEQVPGVYRYRIGRIEVTAINDGIAQRPLDGLVLNTSLAEVETAIEEAFMPPRQMTINFTSIVLRQSSAPSRLVLVDAGLGDLGPPTSGFWMRNFRAAGFDPKDVAAVVISHFHSDHINGLRLKDDTWQFPNAAIHVPAVEWEYWMNDARLETATPTLRANFENVRRVFGPVAERVLKFEWGEQPLPGLTALAAPGHTPGHTAFRLESDDDALLIMSDINNHPDLFVRHPKWQAAFDLDPSLTIETRLKFLAEAADERTQVSFYHAPFPATGHIVRETTGFRFVPIHWTPVL